MNRYREKTAMFFTKLAYGLSKKRSPAIAPLSTSLGSPAPQASLIFELPDELILLILSYISPNPQLAGRYARFCIAYSGGIEDCHNQRVAFLRPLSMTCRAMRLRLLPWVWERFEMPGPVRWGPEEKIEQIARRLNTVVDAFHADQFLASSVRFMKVHLLVHGAIFPLFVKCLRSLPNLHTLEIGSTDSIPANPFKKSLKGVKLPQIKTLIIPPTAHLLLRHCHDVEDVVCVVKDNNITSDEFLVSLASNQDSKVKRLAIPLVLWGNPSQFIAACPRLTELTISPYQHNAKITETGIVLDPTGSAPTVVSEMVNACKALPDFDTLQILYPPTSPPHPVCWCGNHGPSKEQWDQAIREQTKVMKDLVISCLERPKAGCQEGEGRKGTMVRVIRLSSARPRPDCHLGSVNVEEYEV